MTQLPKILGSSVKAGGVRSWIPARAAFGRGVYASTGWQLLEVAFRVCLSLVRTKRLCVDLSELEPLEDQSRVSITSHFRPADSRHLEGLSPSTRTVSQTQSVFCVAPRRDGAGVRPTDHRRDGRQQTGWTKPQRDPSMGIRSSEAGRGQVPWPGGGPGVGGRSRRWGVGGPPAPVWWLQRAHASGHGCWPR